MLPEQGCKRRGWKSPFPSRWSLESRYGRAFIPFIPASILLVSLLGRGVRRGDAGAGMENKAGILGCLPTFWPPSAPRASSWVQHNTYQGPASPVSGSSITHVGAPASLVLGVQHHPCWGSSITRAGGPASPLLSLGTAERCRRCKAFSPCRVRVLLADAGSQGCCLSSSRSSAAGSSPLPSSPKTARGTHRGVRQRDWGPQPARCGAEAARLRCTGGSTAGFSAPVPALSTMLRFGGGVICKPWGSPGQGVTRRRRECDALPKYIGWKGKCRFGFLPLAGGGVTASHQERSSVRTSVPAWGWAWR